MNRMKLLLAFSLGLVALTTSPGCYALASEPIKAVKKDTVYSNESFSITIPKGWEGNDTIGNGPVKDFRSMEIYNKFDDGAWVSIVKSAINVPFAKAGSRTFYLHKRNAARRGLEVRNRARS